MMMAELSGKSHSVQMSHDVLLCEERYMIFLLITVSSNNSCYRTVEPIEGTQPGLFDLSNR